MKKIVLILILILTFVLLVACANDDAGYNSDVETAIESEGATVGDEGVAAVVNGEIITTEQLDTTIEEMMSEDSTWRNWNDDEARRFFALTLLIEDVRMNQLAEEMGIDISDSRVEEWKSLVGEPHILTIHGASDLEAAIVAKRELVLEEFRAIIFAERAYEEGVDVSQDALNAFRARTEAGDDLDDSSVMWFLLGLSQEDSNELNDRALFMKLEALADGDLTLYGTERERTLSDLFLR